jgi:hypothetical protein
MKKLSILKFIFIFSIITFFSSCKKAENRTGNLDEFKLTATFDNGESITFKQFNPETTDAGLMTCGCAFSGDQMTIGFGATNFADPSKNNGFDVGINVPNVTSRRNYESREENADATNATAFLDRIASGIAGVKVYNNVENYRRSRNGSGICVREEIPVGFQTVDITRYSSENGGTIEGTFNINVYHEQDACANYEHEQITGVFKLKRINY